MGVFEVGTGQLADALGVTPRRVQQLVHEGMPQLARGRYHLPECMRWYLEREKSAAGSTSAEDAETREKLARAEWHELRTARLRGQLLAATDVERTWNAAVSAVSAKLDNLAATIPPRVLGQTDAAEVQRVVVRLVEDCKSALRDLSMDDDDGDEAEDVDDGDGDA